MSAVQAAHPAARRHGSLLADPGALIRLTLFGLAVGAGLGIALRGWMRLISTEPEFSWSGTGYIIGAFTVLGTMAGLVTAGRRTLQGWPLFALRVFGIVLSLGCFVGAGATMVPTIVPAALAWAHPAWRRPVRVGLLVISAGAAIALVATLPDLSLARRLLALVIYLALAAVEVALVARLYAPSMPRGAFGRLGTPGPIIAGTLLVAALALMALGIARP